METLQIRPTETRNIVKNRFSYQGKNKALISIKRLKYRHFRCFS